MGKSQLIKYGMREDEELPSSNITFLFLFFNLDNIFKWHVKSYTLLGKRCLSVSLSGSAH